MSNNCFTSFKNSIQDISLPEKFTFPFYYDPHSLSILAAKELQEYLSTQNVIDHNFGLNNNLKGLVIGKMFGVLVVQNQKNEVGYLAAFSGKLAESNHHDRFVPPVFDILKEDGLFRKSEQEITNISLEIENIENNITYKNLTIQLSKLKEEASKDIAEEKQRIKARKHKRRTEFDLIKDSLHEKELRTFQSKINQEGINAKFYINELSAHWENKINLLEQEILPFHLKIEQLKKKRKELSAKTQHQIFSAYKFLNIKQKEKSLLDIFKDYTPPAGAGECAAPKLLQYAFLNNLKPIAMAEFWWGASPKSDIKKHKLFYPSCIGKCKPILSHMLEGMKIDDNPLVIHQGIDKEIEYIYEDDDIIIINKPNELLSVPGKTVTDSVYTRIIEKDKSITGPVIVHRLDMSTSGIMIIAKNKNAYKILQQQFINRSIKKRYVAILDGVIKEQKGVINLPLRVDLNDRPKQLVCFQYGRNAVTYWEVIETTKTNTRINLFPVTGRTHQLRMHCAHIDGLNSPILGDDLYGVKQDRLYLHAESITFQHPTLHKEMQFRIKPSF
ncbi:MAG: RluA family pseudouridine synthase [Flavobacteriales bacterium]|nr:RluA family pseudouridine synthase [Flavobacteriales bacterium]MCB9363975.1 RluA family pseudouridine synthase [Flavobacteriales bacterium]